MAKWVSVVLGIPLVLCVVSGRTIHGAEPQATARSADVLLTYGLFCDPGCGYLASTKLENLGPDVATHVVVQFQVPEDAPLESVSVDYPNRTTSPGTDASGPVTIEVERLEPGRLVSIDVTFYNPPQEGWQAPVTFEAAAAEADPDPSNNTFGLSLSNPFRPVVEQIRELRDPFRLEVLGQYLDVGTFGSVVIGRCEPYQPRTESDPTGVRLIVLGGKELRRALPVGQAVPIVIYNEMGGVNSFTYTRSGL